MLDRGDRRPRADHATGGADGVGEAVDHARPPAVEIEDTAGGRAQLAGRSPGVEEAVVAGVGRGAEHGRGEGEGRGVVERLVEPLGGRASVELGGRLFTQSGEQAEDRGPFAHVPEEVAPGRQDLVAGEQAGLVDARHPPPRSHPEAAQHGRPAAGAVQGVGAEVEGEAVALTAAGPAAEVLGGFEHGDRPPGPGQGGGRGQPGEPASDHDGGGCFHTT